MAATNRTTQRAKRTRNWKPAFLAALADHPDVSKAARLAGVSRSVAYDARQADETFALAWHDALNASLDELEAALIERAVEKDTQAAIFLLKSHRRDVYGDNLRVEHSGSVKHDVTSLTDEQLDELAQTLT